MQLRKHACPSPPPPPPDALEPDDGAGDWSDRTTVELLPFGERVHQEKIAKELFDASVEITNPGKPLDLTRFARRPPAPRRQAPILMALPPEESRLPLIAGVFAAAAALLAVIFSCLD